MKNCCAGICGGDRQPQTKTAEAPLKAKVTKPTIRLDEADTQKAPEQVTVQELCDGFSMMAAPPGRNPPVAICTSNFQKTGGRLLCVIPSENAAFPGAWDSQFAGDRGATAPMVRWAAANGYAVAVFSVEAFRADPQAAWDCILKGSPARVVSVVCASGALPSLISALAPVHALLYSRLRTVCVMWGEGLKDCKGAINEDLRDHMAGALTELPAAWAEADAFVMHQCLFQTLADREDTWQKKEMNKYSGLSNMKENDVPGLRRIGLDERVAKLDRDRGNDELARLCRKHEKERDSRTAAEEEDEPGVD